MFKNTRIHDKTILTTNGEEKLSLRKYKEYMHSATLILKNDQTKKEKIMWDKCLELYKRNGLNAINGRNYR